MEKYSRFHTITNDYIAALNEKADPEELHSRLRSLLFEAIQMDITLVEVLEVLTHSFEEGGSVSYREHVRVHYNRGVKSEGEKINKEVTRKARIKKEQHEEKERKEYIKKRYSKI